MRIYLDFCDVYFAPKEDTVPIEVTLLESSLNGFQYFNTFNSKDDKGHCESYYFDSPAMDQIKIDFKRVPGLFHLRIKWWERVNVIDGMTYPSTSLKLLEPEEAKLILDRLQTEVSLETVDFYKTRGFE